MTEQEKYMLEMCEITILKMSLTGDIQKDIRRLGAILSLN